MGFFIMILKMSNTANLTELVRWLGQGGGMAWRSGGGVVNDSQKTSEVVLQ